MVRHRRHRLVGVDQNNLDVKDAESLAGERVRDREEERREDHRASPRTRQALSVGSKPRTSRGSLPRPGHLLQYATGYGEHVQNLARSAN